MMRQLLINLTVVKFGKKRSMQTLIYCEYIKRSSKEPQLFSAYSLISRSN